MLFNVAVENDRGITPETRFIAVTGLRERALLYGEEETVAYLLTIALRKDGSGGERDALANIAVKGLNHIRAEADPQMSAMATRALKLLLKGKS